MRRRASHPNPGCKWELHAGAFSTSDSKASKIWLPSTLLGCGECWESGRLGFVAEVLINLSGPWSGPVPPSVQGGWKQPLTNPKGGWEKAEPPCSNVS